MQPVTDELFMSLAIGLAERGRGRTSPNPVVGAVVGVPLALLGILMMVRSIF